MLELNKLLWVVPGIVFLFLYNKRYLLGSVSLSGWPYIFTVVIIATTTWLPAEYISSNYFPNYPKLSPLILSIIFSFLLFSLVFLSTKFDFINKFIFPAMTDNFCQSCVDWEDKAIILTLKSKKAYIGILWKYPENPKARYENQIISILVIISGYRKKDDGRVEWNVHYPKEKSIETIIPRSEIVTFSKFSNAAYSHFKTQNNTSAK